LSSSFLNNLLIICVSFVFLSVFFFPDTATTAIYTLSLHDALPICFYAGTIAWLHAWDATRTISPWVAILVDTAPRKTTRYRPRRSEGTRLNSSHGSISYAVFCLKKKKKT